MKSEVANVVREVLLEALDTYDRVGVSHSERTDESDALLTAQVHDHFLDRWYRFAPFGVTSRADLAKLRIEIKWEIPEPGEFIRSDCPERTTSVIVLGTPLEEYAR